MSPRRVLTLAFVIGLMPALGPCNRDAEVDDNTPPASEATSDQAVRVTDVELGRSIDAQGRVSDDADTDDFAANDTIYASINTEGSAAGPWRRAVRRPPSSTSRMAVLSTLKSSPSADG